MNSSLRTVRVDLGQNGYDIEIGAGILDRVGPFLAKRRRVSHAVVVTDTNVENPHATRAVESIKRTGAEVDLLVIEPGEPSKSIESAAQLWKKLLELGTDRKSVVVPVGGGVVGDLAGFIAATFARGIAMVQVPTSLLAQVDSSVGGKTGINLPGAKNMVGAFWQPAGVLIDTETLDTLKDREYRSGLAEVVKYGVILDADLFAYLEANVEGLCRRDHDVLSEVVARCCRLKADVVAADEREETGHRAILNYGHTFGHAFEAVAGYGELLHGEGVAIGMLCASRLAEMLGRVDARLTQRQHDLLEALHLPVEVPDMDRDRLIEVMQHDKKVEHGHLRFVLPTKMGHVELVSDVDPAQAKAAIGG